MLPCVCFTMVPCVIHLVTMCAFYHVINVSTPLFAAAGEGTNSPAMMLMTTTCNILVLLVVMSKSHVMWTIAIYRQRQHCLLAKCETHMQLATQCAISIIVQFDFDSEANLLEFELAVYTAIYISTRTCL